MGPEDGHAAVEMALAVGLILIPAALIVLGFGPWSERTVLAEAVAAEASRAAVLDLSTDSGTSVMDQMAANYGLGADAIRIGWCGAAPTPAGAGDCVFERGGSVLAVVEVWVPLVVTPWGSIGGLWVTRNHSESIDLYRSLG